MTAIRAESNRDVKSKVIIECMNILFCTSPWNVFVTNICLRNKKNTLPIFIFTKKKHVCQSITFEYECVNNFNTLSKWKCVQKYTSKILSKNRNVCDIFEYIYLHLALTISFYYKSEKRKTKIVS